MRTCFCSRIIERRVSARADSNKFIVLDGSSLELSANFDVCCKQYCRLQYLDMVMFDDGVHKPLILSLSVINVYLTGSRSLSWKVSDVCHL